MCNNALKNDYYMIEGQWLLYIDSFGKCLSIINGDSANILPNSKLILFLHIIN